MSDWRARATDGVVTLSQTERNLPSTANVDARNLKDLARALGHLPQQRPAGENVVAGQGQRWAPVRIPIEPESAVGGVMNRGPPGGLARMFED